MSSSEQAGADLSTCDREPITRLERVQSFGFLLAMSSAWVIVRASDNLAQFFGADAASVLGTKLDALVDANALHDIRNRMLSLYLTRGTERLFGVALKAGQPLFDLSVHQSDNLFILEGELSGQVLQTDAASIVRGAMARLVTHTTVEAFYKDAVRQVKAITGFDRVMIYRFAEDGAGEVIAEAIAPKMESYLGLHYPASDIPVQARALYLRNPFRIISDVAAATVALLSKGTDASPLDLTLSVTRAVSPVHIEYLRNMGVAASLSISIIVQGQLWGLFACHHATPRLPSFVIRTAAELLGQMFSFSLESRLRQKADEYDRRLREATSLMVTSIVGDDALITRSEWLQGVLQEIIEGDGTAIIVRSEVSTTGSTPSPKDIHSISVRLRQVAQNRVFATDSLPTLLSEAAHFAGGAAGMLAIPISSTPRDYIMLFRREQLQSKRWAGDPSKPVKSDPNARISPRESFEVFAETVKGRSLPFTRRERDAAEVIRSALVEVILRVSEKADEARKRLSERQEVLIAELNHRVRTVLALMRSVVKQSRSDATDIDTYVDSVTGRIQSLARAHDRMTRQDRSPALLSALLEDEIEAYVPTQRERLAIIGPPILLRAKAFATMALVLHELVTNSCKHGALSGQGRIEVNLKFERGVGLHVGWRERGGPPVKPPTRRGFGTVIIERTVPFDLHGKAQVDYAPSGFQAQFFIPAEHLAVDVPEAMMPSALAHSTASFTTKARPLEGMTVLLLEDNLLVALEGEDLLRALGASHVESASSVEDATLQLDSRLPQFAMLDVNLGAETSLPIAQRLRQASIPHIFASGYGEDWMDGHPGNKVFCVAKPYDRDYLSSVINECLHAFGAGPTHDG